MTRLKALELFGFKSFADRTCFEFPAGITAVVGPNGAGKSNVVDAIKWVLGEQSARSLRGKEMTDVIFAGSAGRRPLNVAEVALVFDNVGRELPVAADEVRIMRRVYRAGESEYLVNGEPARLRDIRELFSGTGAATQAYSVIEQGRVDALLVASGRDRRAVFEEAAGITRFRGRRAEALRRLERAEQNRQRLADIAGEVSSRLEVVRHQAARARRWKQHQERLRTLRLAAATRDLAAVDATVAAVQAALAAGRAASEAAAEEEQAAAAEAERASALHEQTRPRLTAARAAAEAAAQRAVAAEATVALLSTRRAEYAAELERAATMVHDAVQAERRALAAKTVADVGATALAATLADIAGQLAARERAAAGSHDDAASARDELAAGMAELDEARRRQLRLAADRDLAMARAADARHAADAARAAVAAAGARLARLGEARAAGEGQELALLHRVATTDREIEGLEASQRETTAALQAAWRDLAAWQAASEAARERQGMLRELIDRHEGVSEAARRLLAEAPDSVPGFGGMVAATLESAVEWAPLVDVVLGPLAHGLLVQPLADAVDWQVNWAESPAGGALLAAGGRVAMVCPDELREPDPFDPAAAPGVVGRLDRLVTAAAPPPAGTAAATLLRRLLGSCWVVERLADAVPLLATAPAGTSFITRRGDRIVAGGAFEFGAPAAATGLVARRAELRALEARARELDRAVGDATSTVQELQSRVDRLADDVRHAAARRRQDAEALATTRGELSRGAHEHRAAEEAAAAAERDARAAEQRAAGADAEAGAARAEAEAMEPRVAAAAAEVARCQAAITALEHRRGAAIDEIHRLRVEHAAGAERLARSRDAAAAADHACGERRDELARARRHEAQAIERLAAHDLELLAAGAERAESTWAAARDAATVQALLADCDAAEHGQRTALARIEAARRETARLAAELHARELEAGEAHHQRARIVERIRDEYDIDIDATDVSSPAGGGDDEPVPDDRGELEARIEELRRKLASMSTVNLAALAEAEELAERLAKLEAQLADVTAARAAIEQLITRIDDESRRLLGDTIEAVRGHFRELFERVFGGGQADVVLEPGVDLLEAAVEIVARPPGKEPRNITLLSGGEKTMTCVALLLAIFRSRPSPFCVLDEVDAALDEANVDRFVGVLRDFLSATQFIVVTHSKKTMAAANTLYGVTMEESGVSKRISVRFESTAAREAARAA